MLIVTYSQAARQTLRNVCSTHAESVVRRFGRAALFGETELAALLALRLREKHGGDIQIERTEPFNEFATVSDDVRSAAAAYENRDSPSTSYAKFAAGTDHPNPDALRDRDL